MLDPFRLCLTLGPVAVYLGLLGAINLSRRPFLVSGVRDAAALGLAVSGFLIIGPVELFFPDAAAVYFGPYVWFFLLTLYALCLALVMLLLRPRVIVYNISIDQLRPLLADLVTELDSQARWAGDSLVLPGLGVQLHLDHAPSMRNVSLVSVGPNQSHAGWQSLQRALAPALSQVRGVRNARGASFVCAGVLIVALLMLVIARDPQAVARAMFEMLRIR